MKITYFCQSTFNMYYAMKLFWKKKLLSLKHFIYLFKVKRFVVVSARKTTIHLSVLLTLFSLIEYFHQLHDSSIISFYSYQLLSFIILVIILIFSVNLMCIFNAFMSYCIAYYILSTQKSTYYLKFPCFVKT